jgi:hypothetical protein
MRHALFMAGIVFLITIAVSAQVATIMIPAGSPEDEALRAISAENDGRKRVALLQDFLQKFSSNFQASGGKGYSVVLVAGGDHMEKRQVVFRVGIERTAVSSITPIWPVLRPRPGLCVGAQSAGAGL